MGRTNHAASRVARTAALVVLAAAATAVAGCTNSGSQETADLVNGKQLFVEKCGSCHTMGRAGTKGLTGPNLDEAFAVARAEDWGDDSIRGVVLGQIGFPGRGLDMPADIVTGEDAEDVAAYVATVAARKGEDTGLLATAVKAASGPAAGSAEGKVFTTNCGSCHTLAATGSTGTAGPDLDKALTLDEAGIETQIAKGKGAMPGFEGQLKPDEISALAKFVAEQSGK